MFDVFRIQSALRPSYAMANDNHPYQSNTYSLKTDATFIMDDHVLLKIPIQTIFLFILT